MTIIGGWGLGNWGETPWGSGIEDIIPGPPTIIPLDPVDGDIGVSQTRPLLIRIVDDTGVDFSTITVIVNGLIWFQGGSAQNGAEADWIANGGNGFDIVLAPPAPYPFGSFQTVLVVAQDVDAEVASVTYQFLVGFGLRLLKVRNPFENALLAYFNRPLLLDGAFFEVANWQVTPISEGAAELTITEIAIREGRGDVALLRYVGGGSRYLLTVRNLHGQEGEGIEDGWDHAEFEIDFGDEVAPTIRLFDSIWGPLGISQRLRKRRKIDDHVANRSLALALDEQFRLRMQTLDGSVGRDGRPGKQRL